jgi:hypothetical protein
MCSLRSCDRNRLEDVHGDSLWRPVLTAQVYLEGQQLEVWRDELLRELKHIQAFKYVTILSRRGGHGARRDMSA